MYNISYNTCQILNGDMTTNRKNEQDKKEVDEILTSHQSHDCVQCD